MQVTPPSEQGKRPGPESLVCAEVPVPAPKPGEVLVRVQAAGVNRPDVMQRLGLYAPPRGHSAILGLEVAGEVVAVGDGVKAHAMGDRVCALTNGGGYAEFCAVPQGQALRIPTGLSMLEAACIPETFFTVWHNLFQQVDALGNRLFGNGRRPSLLVHGGSSGIGTTAIQLALAFGAEHVFATAGSDAKCAACLDLGATRALNYNDGDFDRAVLEETEGRGVDAVLDMVVGKGYTQRNIDVLRTGGRITIIGFMGGAKAEINMTKVLTKGLTISGSTLRSRDDQVKASIATELSTQVWPLLERGALRVVMDRSFRFSDAALAHRRMEESGHVGKIGLVME